MYKYKTSMRKERKELAHDFLSVQIPDTYICQKRHSGELFVLFAVHIMKKGD